MGVQKRGNPLKRIDQSFHFLSRNSPKTCLRRSVMAPPPQASSVRVQCAKDGAPSSSPTFLATACSQVPSRHPCFLMVDQHLSHSVIFDASEGNWKNLHHLSHFKPKPTTLIPHPSLPTVVFSASATTSDSRVQSHHRSPPQSPLHPTLPGPFAVSMTSLNKTISSSSFRIVLVTGEFSISPSPPSTPPQTGGRKR
ncbi:hypothetical protein HPP92_001982 [Vanilla planifolia]|uniref:Uncharacterized protein n=1 Tax=Vanilla planifolia TaxID=51239 RepID=A0A835VLX4_VANPL|nr:hypothetical protein HPP92_001982 [Vanilla planifolia]